MDIDAAARAIEDFLRALGRDPEREPELVARDVTEGKVSLNSAHDDYGVVLVEAANLGEFDIDAARTEKLREQMRARRRGVPLPMIDRGEGYIQMLRQKVS